MTFAEIIQQADSLGVASFLVVSKSWPFCDDGRYWQVTRHADLYLGQSRLPALQNGRLKLGELEGASKEVSGDSKSPVAICPP